MHSSRRGFALALVLISTTGLFALVVQSGVSTRAAIIEARAIIAQDQARRSARAAVALAIRSTLRDERVGDGGARLNGESIRPPAGAEPPTPEIELPPIIRELLGEMVGDIEQRARESRSPRAHSNRTSREPWRAPELSALPISLQLPGDSNCYTVMLADAAGQLNINLTPAVQLESYLRAVGVEPLRAQSIAHEMLDWIDEDHFVRERGAEDLAYARQGVTCANRPMITLRELLYLPSMSPDLYARIRDDLSVEGDGRIHLATASREVLLTLQGVTSDIVARILERRARGPISSEQIDELLPLAAREAKAQLKTGSSPFIRVRVEVAGPDGGLRTFHGLAVLTRRGLGSLHLIDD